MKLYAGTSGYGFREWTGAFYPEGTRPRDFLAFYSSVFNSVEINYTFRRFPRPDLTAAWAANTPLGFRFAIKAHQGITHRARLRDTADDVAAFRAALAPLGGRLGPILFQCPPWLRRDDDLLGQFLDGLPATGEHALEFRHESWRCAEVEAICRARGASLVAGISALDAPLRVPVTADFAYIRLRRDPPYSAPEEEAIASVIRETAARVERLYVYVKHDGPGLAPAAVRWIQGLAAESERVEGATAANRTP